MGKHLTQDQKEEARTMRVDGKSIPEIQAYLKKEYGIKITEQGVRYVCKGCAVNKAGGEQAPIDSGAIKKVSAKRRGRNKATPGNEVEVSVENLVVEIKSLITQFNEDVDKLNASYKQTLLGIRAELLKSRQQFRDMNPKFDPDKE
jgi:hypothetical protein